jgi:hypothetical protein
MSLWRVVCWGIIGGSLAGCDRQGPRLLSPAVPGVAAVNPVQSKVELDLTALDAAGLRGPADGKVAVAYEFSIPDRPECRDEVVRIDHTVELMPGARGRIGSGPGEILCIGSTHQPDYCAVLESLAALPYVARIIECHHE